MDWNSFVLCSFRAHRKNKLSFDIASGYGFFVKSEAHRYVFDGRPQAVEEYLANWRTVAINEHTGTESRQSEAVLLHAACRMSGPTPGFVPKRILVFQP